MTSQRFRKKPIVIEAMQLTENNRHDVGKWCKAVTMYYDGIDIKTALLIGVFQACSLIPGMSRSACLG